MQNNDDRPAAGILLTPVQEELRRRTINFLSKMYHVKGRLGALTTLLIERCLGFQITVDCKLKTQFYNTQQQPTAAEMGLLAGLPTYLRTSCDLGGMYTSARGITVIYACPAVMATLLDRTYNGHDWRGVALSFLESLVLLRQIQDEPAINYRTMGQQMVLAGFQLFHRGWTAEESAAVYKTILYSCEWNGNLRLIQFDVLIYELQQQPLLENYLHFLDDRVAGHLALYPNQAQAAGPPPPPGPQPPAPQIAV